MNHHSSTTTSNSLHSRSHSSPSSYNTSNIFQDYNTITSAITSNLFTFNPNSNAPNSHNFLEHSTAPPSHMIHVFPMIHGKHSLKTICRYHSDLYMIRRAMLDDFVSIPSTTTITSMTNNYFNNFSNTTTTNNNNNNNNKQGNNNSNSNNNQTNHMTETLSSEILSERYLHLHVRNSEYDDSEDENHQHTGGSLSKNYESSSPALSSPLLGRGNNFHSTIMNSNEQDGNGSNTPSIEVTNTESTSVASTSLLLDNVKYSREQLVDFTSMTISLTIEQRVLYCIEYGYLEELKFLLCQAASSSSQQQQQQGGFMMTSGTSSLSSSLSSSSSSSQGHLHNSHNSSNNNNNPELFLSPATTNMSTTTSPAFFDVNQIFRDKSKNDRSLLHMAARYGHANIISYLMDELHANPNLTDKSDSTPIFLASAHGHTEACHILASKGASLNIRDLYENFPLSIALSCGHYETAQALLLFGADLNFKGKRGNTVLHEACEANDWQRVDFILNSNGGGSGAVNVATKNRFDENCLFSALPYPPLLYRLCERFCSQSTPEEFQRWIRSEDQYGKTLLHVCAQNLYFVSFCILVNYIQPDRLASFLSCKDRVKGNTVLHTLVSQIGNSSVTSIAGNYFSSAAEPLVLSEYSSPHTSNNSTSPNHQHVHGSLSLPSLSPAIINGSFSPNSSSSGIHSANSTPLLFSQQQQQLLSNSHSPLQINSSTNTSAFITTSNSSLDMVSTDSTWSTHHHHLLNNHTMMSTNAPLQHTEFGDSEIFSNMSLNSSSSSSSMGSNNYQTPFSPHKCYLYNHDVQGDAFLWALISCGELTVSTNHSGGGINLVDEQNNDGDTALHLCLKAQNISVAHLLIHELGANVKIQNKQHKSAKKVAKEAGISLQEIISNPNIMDLLQQHHSKESHQNSHHHSNQSSNSNITSNSSSSSGGTSTSNRLTGLFKKITKSSSIDTNSSNSGSSSGNNHHSKSSKKTSSEDFSVNHNSNTSSSSGFMNTTPLSIHLPPMRPTSPNQQQQLSSQQQQNGIISSSTILPREQLVAWTNHTAFNLGIVDSCYMRIFDKINSLAKSIFRAAHSKSKSSSASIVDWNIGIYIFEESIEALEESFEYERRLFLECGMKRELVEEHVKDHECILQCLFDLLDEYKQHGTESILEEFLFYMISHVSQHYLCMDRILAMEVKAFRVAPLPEENELMLEYI
ncbi:hypothetical protein C9374_014129 [Naegleria lovaniensis]|uniref:Ankyrin repeat-containing protein n=1 Tax=Naegleria lovaniensis TaxID=51637 RepID=A0AA88H1P1_NAELO|nr:uncharacterized protein C9374_014129 [Naegleria lovaniensis]KAG2389569.1 hypothetical protein C9374_014129 [Naegleria lovaniensis]